jgi:hypothetical protein
LEIDSPAVCMVRLPPCARSSSSWHGVEGCRPAPPTLPALAALAEPPSKQVESNFSLLPLEDQRTKYLCISRRKKSWLWSATCSFP